MKLLRLHAAIMKWLDLESKIPFEMVFLSLQVFDLAFGA